MVQEGALQGEVAHGISSGIEVEQAVKSDGHLRADEGAYRRVRLEAAARADAYQLKSAQDVALLTCLEVDVGQGVQLVQYDVDVVASDAGADYSNAFVLVGAGDCMKLTALHVAFLLREVACHEVYPSGVAHEDDLVGQPFGAHVEVEYGTVFVDDKLGGSVILLHDCVVLLLLAVCAIPHRHLLAMCPTGICGRGGRAVNIRRRLM